MAKEKQTTIEDLQFDDRNFNRHTEFGLSLVEKSLRNNGAGRSILIDKNNRIIGGNGVVEVAGQIGMNKVRIVESDGTEIIAVKRTDIDLDSKQGREMALADNATASADLQWDFEAIKDSMEEYKLEPEDWGVFIDIEPVELKNEKSKSGEYINFRGIKIPLTEVEGNMLENHAKNYADVNGTFYGYINSLLNADN